MHRHIAAKRKTSYSLKSRSLWEVPCILHRQVFSVWFKASEDKSRKKTSRTTSLSSVKLKTTTPSNPSLVGSFVEFFAHVELHNRPILPRKDYIRTGKSNLPTHRRKRGDCVIIIAST